MNELQIVNLEGTDITTWNFGQLKEELRKALSVFDTAVYTDETIKMAKEDKATLAKAKKVVEDQRKAYKERCLAPYRKLEPQIKELSEMIETQREAIDEVVKEYTERQKAEKETAVRSYYDRKSMVLGAYAAPLYEKIKDPKWLNASASKSKVEEEILAAINHARDDMDAIRSMESPFADTLLQNYVETLSLDAVKAKNTELMEAAEKAGMSDQRAGTVLQTESRVLQQPAADAEEGVLIRVYADQRQLDQVLDFMKAIGVNYEIQ